MTFIVRVTVDASGRIQGVIERVKTGAKHAFDDLNAVGPLIASMARDAVTRDEEREYTP
jgi:hypothetical protein